MFLFCLVFAMFCARLFICALWSPAGKGLTSRLSFVVSSVSLSLSHWYPGSGVVLDCIDSWSLHHYLLELFFYTYWYAFMKHKRCHSLKFPDFDQTCIQCRNIVAGIMLGWARTIFWLVTVNNKYFIYFWWAPYDKLFKNITCFAVRCI